MAYTSINDPTSFFNTVLYTGNGSTNNITGVGFQPDWVWLKIRSQAYSHRVFDSVRGANKRLYPNTNEAEDSPTTALTSFDSDGFSLGSDTGQNQNTDTFVSWNWKAGTSFTNDASATSVGSIDSAGSVNETAGFSICTYTGVSSAGTIKHGLSTVPSMIIWKNRSASNGWIVYHHKNTSAPETDYLELHANNATVDLNTIMNDTAPTSSVFSIGTEGAVGGSNTNNFVAYVFSERKGYSKFGSYTGNGNADGPFVYTGFKPAFIMYKNTARAISWLIHDNKRLGYNPDNDEQHPDTNAADGSDDRVDILSNGFKIRESSNLMNVSGEQVIYMAFAESPFVNSNGVPNNAR